MSSMERDNFIQSIQQVAKDTMPESGQIILFGSQARGDARPDSDWDLLILIDKEGRTTNQDFDHVAYPFIELGWKLDADINPILYTKEEWQKRHFTPFYKNIAREGIELSWH